MSPAVFPPSPLYSCPGVGSGIHFRTTYKIGIEISAVSRSFLPLLGPCVEQRNTTLYAMLDLARLLMSEVNPANTKFPK